MNRKQKKMLIRIIISAVLTVCLYFVPSDGILRFFLFLVPYLVIGYDILIKAFRGILNRQIFDENFLMAVATVGAMVIGLLKTEDYIEAVAVMLFYQTGELFQSYAVGKSRRNIGELMDIRPDYANIESDGDIIQIHPDEVTVGSVIVVNPGEKIPLDGIVTEGRSELNTCALTGESVPRDVAVGDEVFSGCINQSGTLKIKTSANFGESTVAKILELVENASSRKSRSEDFIAKFAKYYTPTVCLSALLLAVVPPIIQIIAFGLPGDFGEWVYRALTFLVISCPCALVVSIPLSFFAGIGGAGKEGILIKGSNYLEALSKTKTVVFDKTGTLTKGTFEVVSVHCTDITKERLIEIAALAESASSHPISKSLQTEYGKELDRSRVSDIREISGNGITAKVDGIEVAAGNAKLMNRLGIKCPNAVSNGTVVHVAANNKYCGHILISDSLKPSSKDAVRALKNCGIKKTVMLTGDSVSAANEVAASLQVDEYHAELLPDEKVAKVEELLHHQAKKEKLMFVGDGINDAPVLMRADIGIAMGTIGSDAAIEAADIVLMNDDPIKISKAVKISKKCMHIVYQNIIFALGVKLLCLILGAFGIANMWLAVFADVGVMILAVLNAIRVMFVKNL